MNRIGIFIGIVIVFAAIGCGSPKPKIVPYTLKLQADQDLRDLSVAVDVVGLKFSEKEDFERYSVSKYWQPGDPERRDALKKTFRFGAGARQEYTIDLNDPMWNEWRGQGVRYLAVIADLPGVEDDRARRKIIDLDRNAWDKKGIREGGVDTLRVRINESRLVVDSQARVR